MNARAIEIQISARVRKPRGVQISPQLLREAIQYRLERGEDPPGIRLRICAWKKGAKRTDCGTQDQTDAWERFGPVLRERLLDPNPIRTSGRTRRRK